MKNESVIVLSGDRQGQRFNINQSFSIGRNPENDLHLDDPQASRKHAIIQQKDNGTFLRDLGSGNGTYIGTRRVLEYKLSNGDILRIGDQEIRFESDATEEVAPPDQAAPAEGDQAEAPKKDDSGVRFDLESAGDVKATSAENVFATFFQAPEAGPGQDQLQAVHSSNASWIKSSVSSQRTTVSSCYKMIKQMHWSTSMSAPATTRPAIQPSPLRPK
jgi:pSer/pThr/pTyr-binding forkhead associated (FHA) protein